MSTTTTNYNFVKPALSDAPPDITATNSNWDKVDSELAKTKPIEEGGTGATTAAGARLNLKAVCISGDTMDGNLTFPYRTDMRFTDKGSSYFRTARSYETVMSGTTASEQGYLDVEHVSGGKAYAGFSLKGDSAIAPYFYLLDRGTRYPVYAENYKPYYVGTFTGNGAASRYISLNFKPSAVILFTNDGRTNDTRNGVLYGGMALPDNPLVSGTTDAVKIGTYTYTSAGVQKTSDCFYVYNKAASDSTNNVTISTNKSNVIYFYIALR